VDVGLLFSLRYVVYKISYVESRKNRLPIEEIYYIMQLWTFFDFVSSRGRNEIHDWLNSKEVRKEAKAKINARLVALQGFPIFPEQYFSAYDGWPDLYELRVGYSGVEYRPFGCYGPNPREFTLLVGSIEKGKVPKSTLKVANERRKLVFADSTNRVRPHDYS
jgi:hypothetical protein